jgi:hypothetical protein
MVEQMMEGFTLPVKRCDAHPEPLQDHKLDSVSPIVIHKTCG